MPGVTRFRRAHPCPICGGGDDMPRGRGQRCSGYLSSDGRFAYCTREEHAGQAALEDTDPASYRHILEGECRCGATHNPARTQPDDIDATYDYLDKNGKLVYQVVRLPGKQFRQRRPDGAGGWIWNMQGVTRVLYRLPVVLDMATLGETIYVVEGEKDVHAIEKTGAAATTSPGGAGKWRPEYAQALQGARVIIVADNDEPGRQHAHQVAQTLPAATTTIVRAATGKDATDHLNAGKTLDELVPLEAGHAPADQPTDQQPIIFETLRQFLKRTLPKSESLVGVARQGTNLLPRYGWVMPWGREGSGKTSILVDLLFHAAAGIKWLHYPISRPLRIVVIVNEGIPGGLQDKLAEKLELWDGPTDQVLDNLALYVSPWGEFKFNDPAAAQHARDYAVDFTADYVAADPLHTLGTTGAGTPQETEDFKHLLRNFGLWNDLGVITAHHSNKNGMVSGDWARHPDTVIRLEKDGKNPASKYTLEKARPADPDELGVPQLLQWLPETMSYKLIALEQHDRLSDTELLGSIRRAIADAPEPLNITALQKAVGGDTKRVSAVAKHAVEIGELRNVATTPNRYLFATPETFTDFTDFHHDDAQTRMDTPDPFE
jgi:5S rRNA maturation endonuclease (ribonuclease M5)